MRTTLFVRELTAKGNGKLRQVAVDTVQQGLTYVQGVDRFIGCNDALTHRVEIETLLGTVTGGPILALIDCGK